jgi:hypothetical protein
MGQLVFQCWQALLNVISAYKHKLQDAWSLYKQLEPL